MEELLGFPSRRCQLLVISQNKIDEIKVFDSIPTRFHRIQLRRVRREIMKLEPIRVHFLENHFSRKVGRLQIRLKVTSMGLQFQREVLGQTHASLHVIFHMKGRCRVVTEHCRCFSVLSEVIGRKLPLAVVTL